MGRARDEAGNIWETDAQGNPVRLLQPSQQQMPVNPAFPYQGAQAAAQAANTGAQAQVNQATVPAQITSANADATAKTRTAQTAGLPEGFMWGPDGRTAVPIPGYTRQGLSPEVRQTALNGYNNAASLERIANDLEQQYNAGPGKTHGVWGLGDYLPTSQNQRFDSTADQARGYVKQGLGFTGGEGNTIGEITLNYGPYLPQAGDRDEVIVGKIQALRNLARDSRAKATSILGGVPDANGTIVPAQQPERRDTPPGIAPPLGANGGGGSAGGPGGGIPGLPNALTMDRLMSGGPSNAGAAPGGSLTGAARIPPAMQAEYEAALPTVMRNGRFDPQAYAQMRSALDKKYFGRDSYDTSLAWAERANAALDSPGGASISTTIPAPERDLSTLEMTRNTLVNNPVGAAVAGFADMGGFGGVSMLAPDAMTALGDAQPGGMLTGQIAGSIGGTSALGKLGTETIGRALPSLLRGGKGAQFARNLATDAAYSGIYGGTTEGDPVTGAVEGALTSAGGQGFGKLAGRVIGGLDISPAVQSLKNLGIPMTVPQQLGGIAKTIEDKAMSVPLIGDMIRNRRVEGLGAFNRQAFSEAGNPIAATVNDIGQEGIQQLGDQVSDAYSGATNGVSVPFDATFPSDFAGAVARGSRLPPDLRQSLGQIIEARVAPITDTGAMTGDQFQQAMRALKATRSRPPQRFEGFDQDYRDAVTGVMDSLEGQMMRGGGDQTVAGLSAANAANKNLKTIENAADRAAGGSETGTPFMFTPSQLQRAGMATEKRYPGPRPFADLADTAQQILPSRIPDSGTAGRAAQMLLPSALAGGAGIGAMTGDDAQGAAAGAGTGAGLSTLAVLALLAGGTKTGQKVLEKSFISRPARAQMIGRLLRDKAGIFGSAALPLTLPSY